MKGSYLLMNKLNDRFWGRVMAATALDARSFCVFRIIIGLYLLCFNFSNFTWLGNVPQVFFEPPILSLASFFNGFPGQGFLLTLNIILLVLACFLLLGIKARIATILYLLLYIILCSFQFSFGKIDHAPVIVLATMFCMLFTDWGAQLALWPDKTRKADLSPKALSLLAILICFAFFTAGFEKFFRWINLDFSTNGTGAWFFKEFRLRGYLLAPYVPRYMPFWAFKIMDFVAVLFELTPLFFLLHSRKAWKIWLIMACLFHLSNSLILNINFMAVFIGYVAFVDYSPLYKSFAKTFHQLYFKLAFIGIALVLFFLRLNDLITGKQSTNIFYDNEMKELNLYLSILVWLIAVFIIFRDYRQKKVV